MHFTRLSSFFVATLIAFVTPLSSALPVSSTSSSTTPSPHAIEISRPNNVSNTGQNPTDQPQTNILYHEGKIMNNGRININIIYYGNWNDTTERNIIQNFFQQVDGTPWFQTLSQYHDRKNVSINGPIVMQSTLLDKYSLGNQLTKQYHQDIVADAINNQFFPEDEDALYFVISSQDVKSEGFCTDYCGYHGTMFMQNSAIPLKYAYVGNAETQCPTGCAVGNPSLSPNNNVGIDGMVNIMAHEFIESLNDPLANAWFDDQGQEAADKCNFNFGPKQQAENNSNYNMIVGGIKYYIQQNWSPDSGACVIGS